MVEVNEHNKPVAYECLELSIDQAVATITLNRPQRLNSFTAAMLEELADALDRVRRDDSARCLLLTGAGRGFCAGQDLNERRSKDGGTIAPDLSQSLDERYNPMVRSIRELPVPVVCAVNGVAAGAGASLALACDIVVAARSASFIFAFCNIGLVPDAGATWILPRLVGRARAMGLAMLGDKLSADQAEDWGLIWRAMDDEGFMQQAVALARRLAAQPTRALALIKHALNAGAANTLDAQLDLERDLQGAASRTTDYVEGVQAFLDKRTPRFKGA